MRARECSGGSSGRRGGGGRGRRASSPATSCGRGGKRAGGGAAAGSGRAETDTECAVVDVPATDREPEHPAAVVWLEQERRGRQARGERGSRGGPDSATATAGATAAATGERQPGASAAATAARECAEAVAPRTDTATPAARGGTDTAATAQPLLDEAQKHQGHLLHRHQVSRKRGGARQHARRASRGAHQTFRDANEEWPASDGREGGRGGQQARRRREGTGRARAGKPSAGQQRGHHADAAEELQPGVAQGKRHVGRHVGALGGAARSAGTGSADGCRARALP
mmetsp:Transcript_4591/g.18406  ORF Transcript_4591/g.18406 Transcript_4591/m.18406 type:complete len:285 (+) Transcript_4591:1630-2484(+)